MTDIVRFPKARIHSWRKDGNIPVDDMNRLAWAICPYLRDQEPCDGCPRWEDDEAHGPFARGCRLMAEEVVNICQTGNPWRKPA